MSDAVFPTLAGADIKMEWEPQFKTKISEAVSGKEYRSAFMAAPIYNLTLSINALRTSLLELDALVGFFLARQGAYDSFLLEHPNDKYAADQFVGVGNGITTKFQLLRSLSGLGGEPVNNIKTLNWVKVNGSTVTNFTHSAGVITFAAAPSGIITWQGEYYYRCRFASDKLSVMRLVVGLWEGKTIKLKGCLGNKI